jgi:phosphonate transport system permease protein
MQRYFEARGLPVPPDMGRPWYLDWRRLLAILVVVAVLWVGLIVTDIDTRRANPGYMAQILGSLVDFNWDILVPQNEFETFWDTALGKMVETIFIAIVATFFSVVVALPLSFLAARNLMTGHPVTAAIYGAIRLLFTVMRSIDTLILVVLFVVLIGGLGTAPGVFAIAFHNIGVIGKLYSEAIEGIDPGPTEAITATGANAVQVTWAAVLPQIVIPFIAFTIYRLDTNVRLAPIVGLVGGGGIGQMLFERAGLFRYGDVGVIIVLIVLTVATMDFVSAQLRKRLV